MISTRIPPPERVRGDPTYVRLSDARAGGGLHGPLDALPAGGGDALAGDDGHAAHNAGDGRWRNPSALGNSGFGGAVGGLRAEAGKSGVMPLHYTG